MSSLPLRMPWDTAQDRWSAEIAPVLNLPPNQGLLLKNQVLGVGATIINHKLSRMQQGWILTDQNAQARIYRSQPLSATTLTLTSDAAVTVSIWVY